MATDRCYTIRKGEGKGIHIPGCMGCAAFGHHACTCKGEAGRGGTGDYGEPSTDDRIEAIESKLDAIGKQLERLLSTAKLPPG